MPFGAGAGAGAGVEVVLASTGLCEGFGVGFSSDVVSAVFGLGASSASASASASVVACFLSNCPFLLAVFSSSAISECRTKLETSGG